MILLTRKRISVQILLICLKTQNKNNLCLIHPVLIVIVHPWAIPNETLLSSLKKRIKKGTNVHYIHRETNWGTYWIVFKYELKFTWNRKNLEFFVKMNIVHVQFLFWQLMLKYNQMVDFIPSFLLQRYAYKLEPSLSLSLSLSIYIYIYNSHSLHIV